MWFREYLENTPFTDCMSSKSIRLPNLNLKALYDCHYVHIWELSLFREIYLVGPTRFPCIIEQCENIGWRYINNRSDAQRLYISAKKPFSNLFLQMELWHVLCVYEYTTLPMYIVHSPKHLYPSYYLFVFSNSEPSENDLGQAVTEDLLMKREVFLLFLQKSDREILGCSTPMSRRPCK